MILISMSLWLIPSLCCHSTFPPSTNWQCFTLVLMKAPFQESRGYRSEASTWKLDKSSMGIYKGCHVKKDWQWKVKQNSSSWLTVLESLTSFDGVADSCCKQDYHARALSGVHLRLHPAVWVRVINSTVLPSWVSEFQCFLRLSKKLWKKWRTAQHSKSKDTCWFAPAKA